MDKQTRNAIVALIDCAIETKHLCGHDKERFIEALDAGVPCEIEVKVRWQTMEWAGHERLFNQRKP